jgi:hypothetical protein
LNNNKKGDPGMLEEDVELAKMRLYVSLFSLDIKTLVGE